MSNEIRKSKNLFLITVIWAAIYPELLYLFGHRINVDDGVTASTLMLLMFLLPIMAFYTLRQVKNDGLPNIGAVRTMLFLIVATPPVYILTGTIAGLFGLGQWRPWLWIGVIISGFTYIKFRKPTQLPKDKSLLKYDLVKKVHRISAFLLVFGFIGLHIFNHAGALISQDRHEELRLLFRSWYASDFVEPVLFLLLIVMAFTGIPMARRYMRSNSDLYKTLQIGSGIYMVFFLCAHVNAVISARYRNVETDWIFATGEQGLVNGYYFLIPYYILSVGMIWLHVSCGIRMVMLGSRASLEKANRTFTILTFIGVFVTFLVGAAVLGIQI